MVLEGWKVVRLNELAAKQQSSFTNGPFGSNLLTSELRSSGVPVIYIRDIKDGFYKPKGTVYVDECKADELSACEVLPGDLLITKVGDPPAIASIYPDGLRRAIITQDVIRLRVDRDKSVPSFVRSLINSPLGHSLIEDIVIEGTRRRVSLGSFKQIKFLLPSLVEQKRISEILDSVDDAIAATQAVIDQIRKVKQGLLQQLLIRGIGHTKFKETAIGLIPESWEISSISEQCIIKNNLRKPINSEERSKIKGIYPYYGPTGIVDYINEYQIEGKHVLIGEDGDHFLKYKTWSMTQLVDGKFNVNNHAHIMRGKDNCSTEWIFHFYSHRNIVPNLTRQGAGRYKLNKATLEELEILVPPLREQKEICKMLDDIDQAISSHHHELECLQQLKQGLMQDLLTGRVRVGSVA